MIMSQPDYRSGPPEPTAAVQYLHLNTDQRRMLCLDTLSAMGAVNVTERGSEIWHSCLLPFGNHAHGDRNPACSVNYEKMVVNCFVCGGGSFQWWVATVQGLDSAHEANTWVTKATGQDMTTGELSINKLEEFLAELLKPKQTAYKPPMPHYDERILDNWRYTHPYMTEMRHVPEPTLVTMQVGWNAAQSQVTIPHIWRGKLVGWQVRNLGGLGAGRPKYKSTPDFPKDSTLYNWRSERGLNPVIVESPMSVLRHLHHCPELMATFGASVNIEQMELMIDRGMRPILWFDNDGAGWNATEQVGAWLMERTVVQAVQCPYVGDPADLPDELFEVVLRDHVVPFSLWRRPAGLLAIPEEGEQ